MSNTQEEIRSAQATEKQQLQKDADVFASLIVHPGWIRYKQLLESVGNNFYQTAMAPLNNTLECVKGEFAKGALTGLSLAAGLPSAKIKEAKELIRPDTDNEG